jgi:teichuronic acid biosynthesis protein TuaE
VNEQRQLAGPAGGIAPESRSSLAADLAYLILGAAAAIALCWAMVRGEWKRIAVVLALAAIVWLVVSSSRLARIRLHAVLFTLAAVLPALGIMGAPLAVPGARAFFAFRLALGLLALLAIVRAALGPARLTIGPRGVVSAIWLWFLWMVVTLLWAPDPGVGLRYLLVVATMLIVTAGVAACGARPRYLASLLWSLGAILVLTLLVSAWELTTGSHLPGSAALLVNKLGRQTTAWFVNTNDLATFLAICWPFLLLGAIVARRSWLRLAAVLLLFGSGTVVLFTGSRSSLVTIGLETVVAAIIAVRWRWIRRRHAVIPAAFLLVLIAAVAVVSFARIDVPLLNQFSLANLSEDVQAGTGSGDVRISLAKAGLTAAVTSFGLGVGPGNAEGMVKQSQDVYVGFGNLHSWWFETFVNSGLPGLLLFSLFYFGLIVVVVRAARRLRSGSARWLAASTLVALVGYVLGAFGPSTAVSFAPMWVLCGLGLAVVVLAGRQPSELEPALTGGPAPALAGPATAAGAGAAVPSPATPATGEPGS